MADTTASDVTPGANVIATLDPASAQSAAPGVETPPSAPAEPSVEDRIATAAAEAVEKEREKYSREYRGIQRTVAAKDQEIARLRAQEKHLAAIPAIAATLNALVSETLGAEKAQVFSTRMENELLKAQQAAYQAPVAPQQTPQWDRGSILRAWFPETRVSVDDPRIDWATDALDTEEAQARFRKSVLKIEREEAGKAARQDEARKRATVEAKHRETLRDIGVETVDGSQPSGKVTSGPSSLLSQNPAEWKSRELLKFAYEQTPERLKGLLSK